MTMEKAIHLVRGANRGALEQASSHRDRVAEPLNSLDALEEDIVRIAEASGSHHISINKRVTVVMCVDNEIVEEGVTQAGQEVTAIVAGNIERGCSCVCLMAEKTGVRAIPVDVGMNCCGEIPEVIPEKVSMDTKNLLRELAMSREQTVMAMETGMWIAESLKSRGYNLAGPGEMGIGNIAISSAVLSVLLDQDSGQVTGRGTGLTAERRRRKIRVIKDGITLRRPDKEDPVDVLSKVGGPNLAALTGFYIGCGAVDLPVVIDGLITGAVAPAVVGICPSVKDCLLTLHVSAESAETMMPKVLGLKPAIQAGMCLGEGTGAVALFPLLDTTAVVYDRMSSFEEIHVEQYEHLKRWNRIWIGPGGMGGRK